MIKTIEAQRGALDNLCPPYHVESLERLFRCKVELLTG